MYEIDRIAEFSAAHYLRNYHGKCENLHGHNWKVKVFVAGETLGPGDMLIDFHEIDGAMKKVLALLDHHDLNNTPPFDRIEPTAENIAAFIYREVGSLINRENVAVSKVQVWETDRSRATYWEP